MKRTPITEGMKRRRRRTNPWRVDPEELAWRVGWAVVWMRIGRTVLFAASLHL